MARFLKDSRGVTGKSPDEILFVGDRRVDNTTISLVNYSPDTLVERDLDCIGEAEPYIKDNTTITWLSIHGVHDANIIKDLGALCSLHPLILEDIVHTGQRPRLEEYENSLFLVLKILRLDEGAGAVSSTQFSLVLGENFVLTCHEEPSPIFHQVKERIRRTKGRIRRRGPDYLGYALVDTVIDNYMVVIENIGSRIEEMEGDVVEDPSETTLTQITKYKHEINYLRKVARPARDTIMKVCKADSELLGDQSHPFWKDLHGISVQATEVLEHYREMLSDHLSIYNTSAVNKLNEIMKVLTVFAAFFIPLTFVAGIYGMNFEFMPELKWKYGYAYFWSIMMIVILFMVTYFKRKKWL